MSIEVKVSVGEGKSRLFKVDNEELMLADIRKKIIERKWEAVGSKFFFLKNGSEIDPDDESEYKLSTFKKDDGIEVVVSPQQQSEQNKTTAEEQKSAAKEAKETAKTEEEVRDRQSSADDEETIAQKRKSAVKEAKEAAQKNLTDLKVLDAQLDPNEKQNWGKAPDNNLIKDEGISKTDDKGVYFKQGWKELQPLLDSFKFPKALKVTSQGLEPVNRPGVKLSQAISSSDVVNETEFSDHREAYYTEWEKQAYKMLAKSISASIGIPIPQLSATLGLSVSYQTSSESLTQSKQTHLFMVAQRLVQKTKVILKEETIQLTEEFKQSVERAQNIAGLREVFQKYGYFVPTTYIIGGKIIAEKTETFLGQVDKTAEVNKFGVGVSAELDKAGFTASASGAYKSESQQKTSQSSVQTASRAIMTLKGGDEGLINDGTQWISSLTLDNWQIVGYEDLRPITDFLDAELKRKCETILSTGTPWLEVQYVRSGSLVKQGDDTGSGAKRDLTVYKPSIDSGWYWVGQYAQGDHNPPTGQTIIVKPLNPDAVKPPIRFEQVWNDKGSVNSKDYSCWKPIPPTGYVALGHIMRLRTADYNPPSGEEISGLVCIHKDLVSSAALAGYSIWDDKGTWASQDCTLWPIKPRNINSAIDAETFYGERAKSDHRPQNPDIYCLKKNVVIISQESGTKDYLLPGESLNPGEKLISTNGIFRLEYQKDGNLVVYKYESPLWASGTYGKPLGQTRFQDNGNLVIYDRNDHPIWSINKYGSEYQESKLIIQDDGNLIAYDSKGNSYWSSGTNQWSC